MENKYAPIVLFVYNRPEHTLSTLKALANNELAKESILYIYCDGPPEFCSKDLNNKIELVRNVIREEKWCREVIIRESKENKGLANSVIFGITEVINIYGKIIVLEDDLLTSKYFLKFMNMALIKYNDFPKVMQISGFSFPAPGIVNNNSSYFLPLTSTWGWATWKRAWDTIDFECKDYTLLKKDKKLAYRFNANGAYNYKNMFIQQMESNKISSWGIRFYWNIFKQNALVLFPDKSLVKNIGFDGSGRHGDGADLFPIKDWEFFFQIESFPSLVALDERKKELIAKYLKHKTSVINKIIRKISTIIKSLFYRTKTV